MGELGPVYLLRPEHLPHDSGEIDALVGRLLTPRLRRLAAEARGSGADPALAALRTALALVALEPDRLLTGAPEPLESAGNRANDEAFGIVRADGDRGQLLLHSSLHGYELLLDDALAAGTDLGARDWAGLRGGFDRLLEQLGAVPPGGRGGRRFPPPAGAGERDALRRWVRGHHVFMVLIQGLVVALNRLLRAPDAAAGGRIDVRAARPALEVAVALMRASRSALQFAGDFSIQDYERIVRPTLTPPHAPPGMSGLRWRDHEHMVHLLSRLGPVLTALPEPLHPLRAELRRAIEATYDAHALVCSRFVGEQRPSLLMSPASAQSAVYVLQRFKRNRVRNVPL